MSGEQRRRRWSPQVPSTPIAALAVAVIAGGSEISSGHQAILAFAVFVAVLALICDVASWRLEREDSAAVEA